MTAPRLPVSRTACTPDATADLSDRWKPASEVKLKVLNVVVVSPTLIWVGVPSASLASASEPKLRPRPCRPAMAWPSAPIADVCPSTCFVTPALVGSFVATFGCIIAMVLAVVCESPTESSCITWRAARTSERLSPSAASRFGEPATAR